MRMTGSQSATPVSTFPQLGLPTPGSDTMAEHRHAARNDVGIRWINRPGQSKIYKPCPAAGRSPTHHRILSQHQLAAMKFLYLLYSTTLLLSVTGPAASTCIDPARLRGYLIAPMTDYAAGEFLEYLANNCPAGKSCTSDRECGSCSCNNWRGVCQE
ncbi:hypothetical protein C8Q76DRAFT_248164 [Earliella scabrosa]|nr:hypothetical protein C8Q76DRAFT_248164 [Earliella scabrosa]